MERLKNMGLKKSFFFLSVWCILISPLPVLSVFLVCNATKSGYPPGSMNMRDGVAIPLEQPTAAQKQVINLLTYFQWLSCIVLPVSGLGFGAVLSYRIKLKRPIDLLRDGTEHIRANDLNFSIPAASTDELGQICAAFETMRLKLLKTNQELWRQSEECRRLNTAFAHDLRNPITVLKGSVKLLRKGTPDEQAIDRLESYTLRIEQYVEAMSNIQRMEQIPVQCSEVAFSALQAELEETSRLFVKELCDFNNFIELDRINQPPKCKQ